MVKNIRDLISLAIIYFIKFRFEKPKKIKLIFNIVGRIEGRISFPRGNFLGKELGLVCSYNRKKLSV